VAFLFSKPLKLNQNLSSFVSPLSFLDAGLNFFSWLSDSVDRV